MDLQEAGVWHKVKAVEQKPQVPAGMAGTPQAVLLADNLTEVLLAMGIWDSAVHQL